MQVPPPGAGVEPTVPLMILARRFSEGGIPEVRPLPLSLTAKVIVSGLTTRSAEKRVAPEWRLILTRHSL